MASLSNFRQFNRWVQTTVADAPREELVALCRDVFAVDPKSEQDVLSYIRYLRR